jgi:hypothetical protein
MRLKGHRRQFGPLFAGDSPRHGYDLLMAPMDAVKIAYSQHTTFCRLLKP